MTEQVVITGWGQVTQRKEAQPPYRDPVDLMEEAARDAEKLAGPGTLEGVDTMLIVRTQSRDLSKISEELPARLGAKPKHVRVSGIGGQVPQQYVNQAAGMLQRGEAESVLICGAETYYPRTADAVRGEQALAQGVPSDYDAEDAVGSSELEARHGVTLPIHGFPLFETALWAQSGLSIEDWLQRVGGMWAGFSEVAAGHPNAWTQSPRTVQEIITPAPDNRPIAFPYTKRMVSLVMADLGSAVLITTEKRARANRRSSATPVYFQGGAYAKDRQRFMIEKADFTRSPALAQAAAAAQARSGMSVADVECFDLYSCFPCAVTVARKELGLAERDSRPLTQTGGLGFFGGPGSNYALHGIASLAETIASGRHRTGMATAIGWFMHKYAVGIYGSEPRAVDEPFGDLDDEARPEAGDPPVEIDESPSGNGSIETYTVIYARDHSPARSVLYGRTAAGKRFVANAPDEPDSYEQLTRANRIGAEVRLRTSADGQTTAEL